MGGGAAEIGVTARLRELDAALLTAHEAGDLVALVRLYGDAGDRALEAGDAGAAAFYLTHAYVFALEGGLPSSDALHSRLVAMGREAPFATRRRG